MTVTRDGRVALDETKLREALVADPAAVNTAMARLNSQGSWLAGQIKSLPTSS